MIRGLFIDDYFTIMWNDLPSHSKTNSFYANNYISIFSFPWAGLNSFQKIGNCRFLNYYQRIDMKKTTIVFF